MEKEKTIDILTEQIKMAILNILPRYKRLNYKIN